MKMIYSKYILFLAMLIIECRISSANNGCLEPTAAINLEINNVRAKILNGGDMFWDPFSGKSGYEIPKGSGKHSSFASGLWLSATDVGNNLYTAGQTYRQQGSEFWPGVLNSFGLADSVYCRENDRLYSVLGPEIIAAKKSNSISYNIARWPSLFANYYDANADGIYDPTNGDYPTYNNTTTIPSQMITWVFNDMGGPHTNYPNSNRLGVEIHATAIAFASEKSDALNNSTIFSYKIINKSNNSYSTFRVGNFIDSDIGGPDDDYVGCDVNRKLFYTYNADNNDETSNGAMGYGQAPPAFGILYLNPGVSGNNNPLTMESFLFETNQGVAGIPNVNVVGHLENTLKGLWYDGAFLSYGTPSGRNGTIPAKFAFPGNTDPLGRPNWVETTTPSGDRRMMPAISPRSLLPGEQMEIEFAFVWARDTPGTNLTSVEKLRLTADTLQSAFQNNFTEFSTGVNSIAKKEIKIYPNPANNYLVVDGLTMINKISIFNAQGKLIKVILKPTSTKINIEGLPQGTYYLNADGYSSKFIKL